MVLATFSVFPFPVFIVLGTVLMVIIVRWYNSEQRVIKRALKQTPLTEMKDVQDGTYVRIRGEVRAVREVMKAPLTGRRCVYYAVQVRKRIGEIGAGVSLVHTRGVSSMKWEPLWKRK